MGGLRIFELFQGPRTRWNATLVSAPCRDSGRVLKRCSEGVQNESMNGKACDLEPDELLGRHPGSHFVFTPHLKLREELF